MITRRTSGLTSPAFYVVHPAVPYQAPIGPDLLKVADWWFDVRATLPACTPDKPDGFTVADFTRLE